MTCACVDSTVYTLHVKHVNACVDSTVYTLHVKHVNACVVLVLIQQCIHCM